MTRLLAIPLVLSICSAEDSASASLENLKARFQARYSEIHRDELEGPLEKLEAQYLEAVSELKKSASAEGNLDLALAAEKELKAFAEKEVTVAEELPELEALQKIYRNRLAEFKKNRSEKLVICWQPGGKKAEVPGNVSNVVELAAGWDFCVARTERGKVLAWGAEGDGRMAVPQRLRDAVRIRAFGHCGAAQQEDGSWLAWGDPINGVVEKINALGPVVDLAMVASQASNPDFYGGYVLWIE